MKNLAKSKHNILQHYILQKHPDGFVSNHITKYDGTNSIANHTFPSHKIRLYSSDVCSSNLWNTKTSPSGTNINAMINVIKITSVDVKCECKATGLYQYDIYIFFFALPWLDESLWIWSKRHNWSGPLHNHLAWRESPRTNN